MVHRLKHGVNEENFEADSPPFYKMKITATLLLASIAGAFPGPAPKTVVIDGWRLVAAKASLAAGSSTYKHALKHLTAQADSWLSMGPWSVVNKTLPAPGGTIHDYTSQAPYWWPNPNTTDGCPYIDKDGQRNPEVDRWDRAAASSMFNSTYTLSLAWYYTGKCEYADHAATILRTWFINPESAMNPDLNHAQLIPCANTGRSIGIIDFSQEYTNVLDAVAILKGSRSWTAADDAAFRKWNAQFLTWLATSPFGKSEAGATNNHGTFANMQITALANFMGNTSLAVSTAKLGKTFISSQIEPDGSQPQELARTRSWHYSNFNLGAHLRWALAARKVGVDLFGYTGTKGQSIFKAVKYLVPAAVKGSSAWTHPELEFVGYAATDNIHEAAQEGLATAQRALSHLQAPPGGDIFPLRPAAEQLDNIAAL